MKKMSLQFLMTVSTAFYSAYIPAITPLASHYGIDSIKKSTLHSAGILTPAVKDIFKIFDVEISTLEEANEFAQKNLLRTGERWDTQPEKKLQNTIDSHKKALLHHLKIIGMTDAVMPQQKKYTYALLMGATKATVIKRLNFLVYLIQKKKIHFEFIVLLGGERELRDTEREGLPAKIRTETDMMEYLYQQNPALKDWKPIIIDAPMIQLADGTKTRPTTTSSVKHFALTAPMTGSCLVISNNPYIIRQTHATQNILDQNKFPTEGAGQELSYDSLNITMVMDEFARALYEDYMAFKKVRSP